MPTIEVVILFFAPWIASLIPVTLIAVKMLKDNQHR